MKNIDDLSDLSIVLFTDNMWFLQYWDLVKNSTLCNYEGNFSFSMLDDDWERVDHSGARVIYKCSKSSSESEKVYC